MSESIAPASGRLASLDAFRGFTIALMIIVNSPGSWSHVYPPLKHAEWNGITLTDLVFPFFLFIMGISISLALSKRSSSGSSKQFILLKIIRRFFILFALGLLLNLIGADFSSFRIPGVLQRIAIVFLTCSFISVYFDSKGQIIWTSTLLIAYWLLMKTVPVPETGIGMLEPGRNLASWVDSVCLPGTLYRGSWDPEGLLSTLPSIATGLTGLLAGQFILSTKSAEQKIIGLMISGFLCWIAGNIWHWFFPINKNLWTSSYVLYTSGLAAMVFACLYWIIDNQKYQKWSRVGIIFGTNAITAYVIHGTLYKLIGFIPGSVTESFMEKLIQSGFSPELASFFWALFYTSLCFIPVWVLYRKEIYIKI